MYVRTLFGQDWTFVHVRWREFFYRVFEFPLSRNAQKRNKKNRQGGKKLDARPRNTFLSRLWNPLTERRLTNATKKSKGKEVKKKSPGKNSPPRKNISPAIFFVTYSKTNSHVSELPCRETPKNALKQTRRKKEGTYVLFLASWRRCTSFSRVFFSVAVAPINAL